MYRVLKYKLGIINSHYNFINQQCYHLILISSSPESFFIFKKLDKLTIGDNFYFYTQNQNFLGINAETNIFSARI